MPSNIQIILVAGAAVLFLVILYLFFRPLFTRKLLQNSIDDSQSMLFEGELEQGTLEFQDHRPIYDWFLDQLDVYHPQQIEFASGLESS